MTGDLSKTSRPRRTSAIARFAPAGLLLAIAALSLAARSPSAPIPLLHGHAHNDYRHTHPLTDALRCGYCSIEADIALSHGVLYVTHNPRDIDPTRTLKSLYLDPLRDRIRIHHGHVYDTPVQVTLLIDIKSAGVPTYRRLRELLSAYDPYLTHFTNVRARPGPLRIILSGDTPRALIATEPVRLVACDGKLADLDRDPPAMLVPLISSNWADPFTWNGHGPFPKPERALLNELVRRAHHQGRTLRFWNAPDTAQTWALLRSTGVDLINTDRLVPCQHFLLNDHAVPRS